MQAEEEEDGCVLPDVWWSMMMARRVGSLYDREAQTGWARHDDELQGAEERSENQHACQWMIYLIVLTVTSIGETDPNPNKSMRIEGKSYDVGMTGLRKKEGVVRREGSWTGRTREISIQSTLKNQ